MSRVLYVEDDAVLQLDGEAWLAGAGYDVVVASDGEEACACLREPGACFDALITDIEMPGFTGWQVAELGRSISRDLSVIYVTGAAACDFRKNGVARSLMVPKPFAWSGLMTSLSRLLAH